jgi:hypothetical protein
MALQFFYKSLRNNFSHEAGSGIYLLQAPFSSSSSYMHAISVHAANLGWPLVEGGVAYAVFAAQFKHGRASLGLLQHSNDVAAGKTGRVHAEFSKIPVRKFCI